MRRSSKILFNVSAVTVIATIGFSASLSSQADTSAERSEFETAVDANSVPYPFMDLYNLLKQKIVSDPKADDQTASCPIPDGRSLVHKQANFDDPRMVLALPESTRTFGQNSQGTPPSFVGYAPQSSELEIISWNKDDRKYDFLLVKDYHDGGKPFVQKADPAVCLSCHQQGGPIFARQLWSESAVFDQNFSAKLHVPQELVGMGVGAAESVDGIVFQANRQLQAIQACAGGCGANLSCRAQMLLGALARVQLSKDANAKSSLSQNLQALVNTTWPNEGFSYPSFVLPDHDPLKNPEHQGTITQVHIIDLNAFLAHEGKNITELEKRQITDEYKAGVDLTYNEFSSSLSEPDEDVPGIKAIQLPYDDANSKGDPTIKRPNISAIPVEFAGAYLLEHATDCFNLSNANEDYLKTIPFEKLQSIANDETTRKFVSAWPQTPDRIMTYIRARVSGQPLADDFFTAPSQAGPISEEPQSGTLSKVPESVISSQKTPMDIFQQYCGKCHVGPNALVEDLGIKSQADLINYKDDEGQSLIDKIKLGIMPADRRSYNPEKEKEWEADKAILLKELRR